MRVRILALLAIVLLVAGVAVAQPTNPAERGFVYPEPAKGSDNPISIPTYPEATGGPDGFGYTFIDSNEAGGPTFNFIDISGSGTAVAGLGDDSGATIPIGFTFSFYNGSYTNVDIASNGYLTFGTDNSDFSNDCPLVAGGQTPEFSIFPYWNDLDPLDDGANAYYENFASCPVGAATGCTIIQFDEFDFFPGDGTPGGTAGTFEAVLYDTGDVLLQYNTATLDGASATVGIWEDSLANSLLHTCNAAGSLDGLAILFEAPVIGDLVVTKTGDVALGGPFAYTIGVTNNGPEDQTGVTVTDTLPPALNYVSDTCGGDFADGVWDIGALANGASVSCDMVVQLVDPNTCIEVRNVATVTGDLFDPPGNSTAVNSNGGAANLIQDESFEAGSPNPVWAEASTNFGTPLCTTGSCGLGGGTGPRTGLWWAWFGGIGAFEDASVSQAVVIPTGATTLDFWLEAPVCDAAGAAHFMEVTVDGNQVYLIDANSPLCNVVGYSQQSADVSAFADGASHTIEFHSIVTGPGTTNFFVDDVTMFSPPTCPGDPLVGSVLEIPTLHPVGLGLLVLLLALAAMMIVRRRREV